MVENLSALIDTVQKNCTIADARHARDMTMCTFLLEMREYYRWEMEIPYGARLPKEELGDWLNARESLWDTVEEEDFAPLPLSEIGIDPFEADDINRALIPLGLVYSSGLGHFRKPHFVLAELKRAEVREGVQVLVAGCEYARDLIAPPAAMRDGAIFLRMDAVRRLLWNKYEEWQWKEKDTALGRAFAYYDFERNIERGLDRMAEAESEAMILHEIGEARAESLLGADWNEMLGQLTSRHAELLVRAVRDHLAEGSEKFAVSESKKRSNGRIGVEIEVHAVPIGCPSVSDQDRSATDCIHASRHKAPVRKSEEMGQERRFIRKVDLTPHAIMPADEYSSMRGGRIPGTDHNLAFRIRSGGKPIDVKTFRKTLFQRHTGRHDRLARWGLLTLPRSTENGSKRGNHFLNRHHPNFRVGLGGDRVASMLHGVKRESIGEGRRAYA